jgi:hypothetical protein
MRKLRIHSGLRLGDRSATPADFPRQGRSPFLPRAARTPRKCGICPSFKGYFLSPRAHPNDFATFASV